jgi:hypothetical protein
VKPKATHAAAPPDPYPITQGKGQEKSKLGIIEGSGNEVNYVVDNARSACQRLADGCSMHPDDVQTLPVRYTSLRRHILHQPRQYFAGKYTDGFIIWVHRSPPGEHLIDLTHNATITDVHDSLPDRFPTTTAATFVTLGLLDESELDFEDGAKMVHCITEVGNPLTELGFRLAPLLTDGEQLMTQLVHAGVHGLTSFAGPVHTIRWLGS